MAGQRWNSAAIRLSFSFLRSPGLLLPIKHVSSVDRICFKELKSANIRALLFDKDNTLTLPYGTSLFSLEIERTLANAKQTFGNDNVAIFSNTIGFTDNCTEFERIGVVQHQNNQKPEGFDQVLLHFNKGASGSTETIKASEIAVIGDRYATDILFGNVNGMYTIYTDPISTGKNENRVVRVARWVEQKIARLLLQMGYKPVRGLQHKAEWHH